MPMTKIRPYKRAPRGRKGSPRIKKVKGHDRSSTTRRLTAAEVRSRKRSAGRNRRAVIRKMKGLTTASIAREIDTRRPVRDRSKDYKTTEPEAPLEVWREDPGRRDIMGVDDKLDSKYSKRKVSTYDGYEIRVKPVKGRDKGKVVAKIILDKPEKTSMEPLEENVWVIEWIEVKDAKEQHKGKNISDVLLREVCLDADQHNKNLMFVVTPVGSNIDPSKNESEYLAARKELADYYSQFGFRAERPTGDYPDSMEDIEMVRKPTRRT